MIDDSCLQRTIRTIPGCGALIVGCLSQGCANTDSSKALEGNAAQNNATREESVVVRRYEEVEGGSALSRPVSACELFARPGPVAVLKFVDIVGVLEADSRGTVGPRIRVTSEVEDVWFGTLPSPFTFRFRGGHDQDGNFLGPAISARRDERVVMLVYDYEGELSVFNELQVFREVDQDRFSNGQLFSEGGIGSGELRAVIGQVRAGEECPFDEAFGFSVTEGEPKPDGEEGPAEILPDVWD